VIGLSTMLQEHMALNTGGTFPEFVSNVMIADDAIRAHKETKKREVVAAPSSSAPPKYRMVYHHDPTYPPRPQHQHPQQQCSPRLPQRQHQRAAPKALPLPRPVMCLPAPPTAGATSGPTCFNCGHSRVHCAEEDSHTGPRHPSTTWTSKGGCCEDWRCQLHHHGRYS
jgi:hypothetical protein